MTTEELLKRAADLLEEEADAIKESHTLTNGERPLTTAVDIGAKNSYNEMKQVVDDLRELRARLTESAPGVEGRGHNRYVPKDGQTHAEPPAATVPESIHEAADIILEVADYINDACNDSTGILGSKSVDPLMRAHALLGDAAPQSGKADYESWSKQNAHAEDVRTRIPGAAPPAVVRAPDDVIKRVQRRIQYVMAANAKHLPDAKVHLFVSDVEHLLACAASGKKEDGWLPIETAPKDGTLVLVGWRDSDLVISALYAQGDDVEKYWYGYVPALGLMNVREPHLWMPLPSPPASKAEGES